MPAATEIELILKFREEVSEGLKGIQDQLKKTQDPVSKLGMAFKRFLAPAAIAAGLKYAISQAAEAEDALNSLRASVEIAGGSWIKMQDQMQDYALQLSNVTKYTDEEVMGVMQRLITITGDADNGWKQSRLALDMAASGMISAEGAARLIALAMEGNVEALGRYVPELKGMNLEHLKGKSAAEKAEYAMSMLNEKFGGRAQAELKTYTGQTKMFKKAIGELAETIGKMLLPVMKKMAEMGTASVNWIRKAVIWLTTDEKTTWKAIEAKEKYNQTIKDLGVVIKETTADMALMEKYSKKFSTDIAESIVTGSKDIGTAFRDMCNQMIIDWLSGFIDKFVLSITTSVYNVLVGPDSMLVWLGKLTTPIWDATVNLVSSFEGGIIGIFGVLKQMWDMLSGMVSKTWDITVNAAGSMFGGGGLGSAVGGLFGPIGAAAGGLLGGLFGFQEGGIVTQPTPALVGEGGPEAIIPLDKMGGMGGVNITINTMAYTGDDRSIRALAREIDKALYKEQRIGRTVTV